MKTLKNNKTLAIILILSIFLVVLIILTQKNEPEKTPEIIYKISDQAQATWEDISPGKTDYTAIESAFGEKPKITQSAGNTLYSYESFEEQIILKEIQTDADGIVDTVNIYYDAYRPGDLYTIKSENKLGDPEIAKYVKGDVYTTALLYPQNGITLYVKNDTKVYQIKYFTPMTKEEFLSKHKDEFTDSQELREDSAY